MINILITVFLVFLSFETGQACELMGFSFDRKIPANNIFQSFRFRDKNNPDGWGVAYYPDKALQVFKEPKSASQSEFAEFLRSYKDLRSKIFLSHVRKSSVGGVAHKNTHPFFRAQNGKRYALIHNGNLWDFKEKLPLQVYKPIGKTDSEHMFLYLLERIKERNIQDWTQEDFNWVYSEFLKINELGLLNVLFTNGKLLFVYHDKDDFSSLYYIKRKGPFRNVYYRELKKDIEQHKIYEPSTKGYIVATTPLTLENWAEMNPGELLVFKKGEIIFQKKGDSFTRKSRLYDWIYE
ncbi:MAG: class II glutamine amidotransferase [Leptospiraceae bacterium]|nr:class II glutamine amidotransferase [Leptospiraceae bacterium]MCP5498370.1 class II glutamine amidotransferase [Leptospiraceae bacterium]